MSTEVASVESERSMALVAYVLHLMGAIAGITSIVGLALNYVWRRHGVEPFGSHHSWMIRTFWWALLWIAIGFALKLVLIGWAVVALGWLWYIYRHVRGLINLINGRRMPR